MNNLRDAAQQALEALGKMYTPRQPKAEDFDLVLAAIAALRAALAQQAPLKRATGWAAPKDRYTTPVLFNPYTGEPRDVRDVQSDPQGILIVPPGAVQLAAKKEQHD